MNLSAKSMCGPEPMNKLDFSDAEHLAKVLEALLLAAAKPLSIERMAELLDEEAPPNRQQITAALEQLRAQIQGRSYRLTEVASGFRLQIRAEFSPWVGRLWEERPQRYSRAMLETLALIAYRQPITRGEIEDVRGVAVSSQIIKTLVEREWVRVVGHKDVPGRPAMLATTKTFLDYFNLRGLDELPNLIELKDLQPTADETSTSADNATAQLSASVSNIAGIDDSQTPESQANDEEPSEELSFGSLLAELDSMEQGLTTDFTDPAKQTAETAEEDNAD